MSLVVQRLIRLCYVVIIFLIRRHVDYFFCNDRIFRIFLIYLTVRSLYESILVNPCISSKRVNQTDVRTFRGLNRAHSSVMGIVDISYLESCTVSWQTSRSKCWQTSLVGQLTKRVVLIHELWQLRRTKELFDSRCYRLDVDQWLRGNSFLILCGHSLTDNSFKSGQTDSVLVLKKFSYRTDTSVAQMVDVILIPHSVLKMDIIVNGSQDVFLCNMLRNQIVKISAD